MRALPLALLAALALGAAPAAPLEHGGKIDWVRDPAFGFAKTKLEGRAAMIFFTADW
jgi:hypothetical protein